MADNQDKSAVDSKAAEAKTKEVAKPQVLSEQLGGMSMEARAEIGLMPNCKTFGEVMNLCTWVSQSEIVPKAYRNKPADVFVAAEYGAEIGLKFMQAIQNIAIISGKPALPSDIKLAMVRGRGLIEYHREASIEESKKTGIAWCEMKRVNDPDPIRHTFSVEDAKTAGLWQRKGYNNEPTPWVLYPYRMLQLKPRDMCLRDKFGDVFKGIQSIEEAQEVAVIEQIGKPESLMIEQSQPETKGKEIIQASAEQPESLPVPAVEKRASDPPVQDKQPEPAANGEEEQKKTENELLMKIGRAEMTLLSTNDGTTALRNIWASFKMNMSKFNQESGAYLIEPQQRTFYLRQLNQALSGLEKPTGK